MSDVILKLGTDTSQMKSGLNEAKGLLRDLDQQANKKGIFEKLNNDVKNFGNTFGTIKDQIGSGNFIGALATASKAGASMAGGMSTLVPVLGGVGLAAGAVGASVMGMWKAMSKADEIGDTAEQSGLLVSELMVLEKSLATVGMTSDELPRVMDHLRDSLRTLNDPASSASKAFEKIGLSAASFEGKSYYEAMKLIGDALGNAKNKTDALTAATVAFGGRGKGVKVGQALAETDFATAESKVPASAAIIQEQGAQFEKFQIAIMRLKPSMDNFFLGMASEIVPQLTDAANNIESSSTALVAAGQTFGSGIVSTFQTIKPILDIMVDAGKAFAKFLPDLPKTEKQKKEREIRRTEEEEYLKSMPWYKRITADRSKAPEIPFLREQEGPGIPSRIAAPGQKPSTDFIGLGKETPWLITQEDKKRKGPEVDRGMAKGLTEKMEPITASLTKVGGGQSGMWTDSLGVQREQLNVLRQISQGISRWGQTFKPDANPMIGINGGDVASIA
jgi:hypothetical protein